MRSTVSRIRPCDTCRARKTRCVKPPDKRECVLCAFHGKQCTYLRGPPSRPRRASGSSSAISRPATSLGAPAAKSENVSEDGTLPESFSPETDTPSGDARSVDHLRGAGQPQYDGDLAAPLSLLHGTLGLDLATHPEYIGPSSYHEPELLGLVRFDSMQPPPQSPASGEEQPQRLVRLARLVDSRSVFLIYPDEATASEPQRVADCDAIEDAVRPLGKALVDLYFRTVHPSYPILHKGVYLTKHAASHRLFSPPLLAAVYLVALEFQRYNPSMASMAAPPVSAENQAALEALAERTMADDLKRPKLSTLQAGLLLLQRRNFGLAPASSLFTAQLVAVAQNLGLHVDCQHWSIPDWEKGLRRRLAWVLYIQDRWGALVQGRLPLLSDGAWDVQPCSPSDFPEAAATADAADDDPNGSVSTDMGRDVFILQIQLTQILSDIMSSFYSSPAAKPGGTLDRMGSAAVIATALPMQQRLEAWYAALPYGLALDSVQHRRMCANASLHVAYAAAEIALHRALLRFMKPDTPADLAREVRSAAQECVLRAINILTSLQPEHLAAFWSGVSAHQIASIGSLIGLLWATTEDSAELAWCTARMDVLRWTLRVRGQAAPFMQQALRLLDGVGAPFGLMSRSAQQGDGG